MMRILIAECMQEVATFNPTPSHYDDFAVHTGAEILDYHRGRPTEVGGALEVFAGDEGLELIPTFSARSITSGGTLAQADWQRMLGEFRQALQAAPTVDGVYICLHGAMVADEEMDPEGRLLAEVRSVAGSRVPVVASFDLHGILTHQILTQVDAFVAYHTYPHVDHHDTGARAARLLLAIMAGECRPVAAVVPIPALVRGDELITETGLLGEIIGLGRAWEEDRRALASGMFIGNPFTDVPELRSNAFVITDNDPTAAQQGALQMAERFWDVRRQLQAPLVGLDQAVEQAVATAGTVILVDAADATSSGASGDGNAILGALLRHGYRGSALIPMVDRPLVEAALQAGIGGEIRSFAGGTLDPGRFHPLPIRARVRLLSDGHFISESHGTPWYAGETAVLVADNITLVVTSRPVSLYDRSLFLAHGQDPQRFDLVVVKSPHCQERFYAAWAARLINVDAPGATSANLPSLGHTRCARPIFPLDEDVPFHPQARIYPQPE